MHRLVVFFFIFLPSHLFAQRTSIRPPSIMSSGWEELTSQSKIDSVYNFFVQTVKSFDSQSNKIVKYRVRNLSFYNDADLIEIEVNNNGEIELYSFVEIENKIIFLNGQSEVIPEINNTFGLNTNDNLQLTNYVEFFVNSIGNEDGSRFLIVRNLESLQFILKEYDFRRLKDDFLEPQIISMAEDSVVFQFTNLYERYLFKCIYILYPSGKVNLQKDVPISYDNYEFNTRFNKNGAIIVNLGNIPDSILLAKKSFQYPNFLDDLQRRQGKWKIFYDKNWKQIDDSIQASYYRIIDYKDDKPIGKVYDYYKSGIIRWQGEFSSDRPEEIRKGKNIWYTKDGNIDYVSDYSADGKLIERVSYDFIGNPIWNIWTYLDNGLISSKAGNWNQAIKMYLEVLDLRVESDSIEGKVLANLFGNLGQAYFSLNKFNEAEDFYLKAYPLVVASYGKGSEDYSSLINNLANVYMNLYEYAKAEPYFLECLSLEKRQNKEFTTSYALTLSSLGDLYLKLGMYDKVNEYYLQAIKIFEKDLAKNKMYYLSAYSKLGLFYETIGDYPSAGNLYEQCIDGYKYVKETDGLDYIRAVSNLACIRNIEKNYFASDSLFSICLSKFEKSLGKNNVEYAILVGNYAHLQENMGNVENAEKLWMESLKITESIYGKNNPSLLIDIRNLASFYYSQGNLVKVDSLSVLMHQISIEHLRKNMMILSEVEKAKFVQVYRNSFWVQFPQLVAIQYTTNPYIINNFYNLKIATKGILFNSTKKIKTNIINSGNEKLLNLYQTWLEQKYFLSTYYQLPLSRRDTSIIIKKEEEKANQLEKELSARSELFAQAQDTTEYTWEDVRNRLKDGEAAIEMVRFRYYDKSWTDSIIYMAMIVTSDTKEHPDLVVLPNGNELESSGVNAFQGSLNTSNYENGNQTRGVILLNAGDVKLDPYQLYWQAIQEKLDGITKVYLSPDGVYNTINVSALYSSKDSTYVFDQLEIQQVTSTRDLVVPKRTIKNTNKAILVGYPDYNGDQTADSSMYNDWLQQKVFAESRSSGLRFFNGEDIVPLPNTKTEIKQLSKIFSHTGIKPTVLLDSIATEANVLKVDNPRILHIATHGFFLKDMEPDTTNRGMLMGMDEHRVFENPLLRSGLLLAHAKQAITEGGDGVLTAYEAMNMNLDNTELVVLSACETGLGEVKNGEGVYGLQRAFQTAGARSVLMSLWNVSDEATMELMILFYEYWLEKKQTKREAFRNAQLELRKKYPESYYWASFVMIGD